MFYVDIAIPCIVFLCNQIISHIYKQISLTLLPCPLERHTLAAQWRWWSVSYDDVRSANLGSICRAREVQAQHTVDSHQLRKSWWEAIGWANGVWAAETSQTQIFCVRPPVPSAERSQLRQDTRQIRKEVDKCLSVSSSRCSV